MNRLKNIVSRFLILVYFFFPSCKTMDIVDSNQEWMVNRINQADPSYIFHVKNRSNGKVYIDELNLKTGDSFPTLNLRYSTPMSSKLALALKEHEKKHQQYLDKIASKTAESLQLLRNQAISHDTSENNGRGREKEKGSG